MSTRAFLIALILLSLPTISKAEANDWTTTDTMLQATFLMLLNIDRSQTVSSDTRPEIGYAQKFIGEHPSSGQANRYFVACGALHTGIALITPKVIEIKSMDMKIPARLIWQSFWITVEGDTVHKNYQMGISISF